jgi:hypothetical protein
MAIKKKGRMFIVTSRSGRVLGRHKTRKVAVRQLAAVEAAKARRKKRRKRKR